MQAQLQAMAIQYIVGKVAEGLRAGPSREAVEERKGTRRAVGFAMSMPGEIKCVDTLLTQATIVATTTTNDNILVANLVQAGAAAWNRVGRKIFMRRLEVDAEVNFQSAAAATTGSIKGNILRVAVVYDRQPSGVLPVFSSIFGITEQTGTESSKVLDPLRNENMDRFVLLADKFVRATPPGDNQEGGTTDDFLLRYWVSFKVNLKNLETIYTASSSPSVIGDISSGGLYLVFRQFTTDTGTCEFTVPSQASCRLWYTD